MATHPRENSIGSKSSKYMSRQRPQLVFVYPGQSNLKEGKSRLSLAGEEEVEFGFSFFGRRRQ